MVLTSLIFTGIAFAEGAPNKPVIQVSTDDPRIHTIALNNAVNLQKHYGIDNIDIEIVAYGPDLGMLTKKSKSAGRVESLAMSDITFSACGNTMAKVPKQPGKYRSCLKVSRRYQAVWYALWSCSDKVTHT